MIGRFVLAWDENKDKLKEHIKTHDQNEYDSYEALVKLLFDIVINPEQESCSRAEYDTANIVTLDDGSYSGTQIFILHEDCYEPCIDDYVYTTVCYGSCSGCDTLQGIQCCHDGLPNNEQVSDYMELCLHLLQQCHLMKGE